MDPAVADPERLAALRATGSLDTGPEGGLDRLTRLATTLLGTPVALVTLVDDDRQFFKSQTGLPEASARETPLSHSFCQYVVASGAPLAVTDAREDPLLCDNPAIKEHDVVSYLGVPLTTGEGHVLGSFCTIDSKPREWSQTDFETVRELAAAAATEIELRARLARSDDVDPLTGLATRSAFHREVEAALETSAEDGYSMALLGVDLSGLDLVNESLGREGGDKLIAAVASRLRDGLDGPLVARISGHQFGILCRQARAEHEVLEVAEQIRRLMRKVFVVGDTSLYAEVTIGIVIPEAGDSADDLLDGALTAARDAKLSPGAVRRLDEDGLREGARQRLHLETAFRGALDREELHVHYQPRVRLRDGAILGFEALARWEHAELGRVSPGEFIPVAEESGLIGRLGELVLQAAVREAVRWSGIGEGQRPFISVNLSPVQIAVTDVTAVVARALQSAGLTADLLRLEITETVLLDRAHANRLRDLVALGAQLDLDDFGTGYCSLGYIAEFPLDGLKIDRSFVAGLGDPRRESIIRAIIAMAEALGVEVTAEGIETEEQRQRLIALGCDFGQGYLFGHPAPPEEARQMLSS